MKKILFAFLLIMTSNATFANTNIQLIAMEKTLTLKEARVFPENCFVTITIIKNRIGYTQKIIEEENEACGSLFNQAEPLSLSFQEETDECGVIKTNFTSQANIDYETMDHSHSSCPSEKKILLKISSPTEAFASMTKVLGSEIVESQNEAAPTPLPNMDSFDIPAQTCAAYFEGFYKDEVTGKCTLGSYSGCSNPFPFQTLNECETGKSESLKLISNF